MKKKNKDMKRLFLTFNMLVWCLMFIGNLLMFGFGMGAWLKSGYIDNPIIMFFLMIMTANVLNFAFEYHDAIKKLVGAK